MNGSFFSTCLTIFEPVLCLAALLYVFRRRGAAAYNCLCGYLLCHFCSTALSIPLLLFGGHGIDRRVAYNSYFLIYWVNFTIEAMVSLLLIYRIFEAAMMPLEGIRRLGILLFRWAACMALVVISGSILLPHVSEKDFLITVVTELERTQGILTLCLLLFVCYAIRPLGLSYRSRIFGILLGLGTLTTAKLLVFGWISHSKQLYSSAGIVDSMGTCIALLIWIGYFVAPEAKRRIVVMPTTSPFLRWNQISEALGDAPGFVAVGGVPPELFAPAELEVMRRASLKMIDHSAVAKVAVQVARQQPQSA